MPKKIFSHSENIFSTSVNSSKNSFRSWNHPTWVSLTTLTLYSNPSSCDPREIVASKRIQLSTTVYRRSYFHSHVETIILTEIIVFLYIWCLVVESVGLIVLEDAVVQDEPSPSFQLVLIRNLGMQTAADGWIIRAADKLCNPTIKRFIKLVMQLEIIAEAIISQAIKS